MKTKEELQAIKARCDAAAAGPWTLTESWKIETLGEVASEDDFGYHDLCSSHHNTGRVLDSMEFVAHARTDIPALLAHIEALEAENAEMRDELISEYWDTILNLGTSSKHDERIPDGHYKSNCTQTFNFAAEQLIKAGVAELVDRGVGRNMTIRALGANDER